MATRKKKVAGKKKSSGKRKSPAKRKAPAKRPGKGLPRPMKSDVIRPPQ